MVKLTREEVLHIANLAKITLTESEIDKYSRELLPIIEHIDELSEVDTTGIEPTSQTTNLENVLREDEIDTTNYLTQEEALSGTENTNNGYIVVPQILKKS